MKTSILLVTALVAGSLHLDAQAVGDADRGKAVATKNNCASCHGADFKSPIDPSYPQLAGQQYDYLVQSLKAYKNPTNRTFGRDHPIMKGMAAPLSAEDIDDVSAYLSGLPGNLITKPEPRF